jgi:serine/threonine protein kinase
MRSKLASYCHIGPTCKLKDFSYVLCFVTQVNSLTKVHHRNLVSLVGYCWEKDHLALVYEYMSQGSLCDQLRGLSFYKPKYDSVITNFVVAFKFQMNFLHTHYLNLRGYLE